MLLVRIVRSGEQVPLPPLDLEALQCSKRILLHFSTLETSWHARMETLCAVDFANFLIEPSNRQLHGLNVDFSQSLDLCSNDVHRFAFTVTRVLIMQDVSVSFYYRPD